MARLSSRYRAHDVGAWPGWVDALSSLVMVVIFLLLVFVVGQVFSVAALGTRDRQLGTLTGKLAELNDLLALEQTTNKQLRANADDLTGRLKDQLAAGEALKSRLVISDADREAALRQIAELEKTVKAGRDTVELQMRQLASLQSDLAALRTLRDKLEGDVAVLAKLKEGLETRAQGQESALADKDKALADSGAKLKLSEEEKRRLLEEMGALRDRSQALSAELAGEKEKTMAAQKTIEEHAVRIGQLDDLLAAARTALADEQKASQGARSQSASLDGEIAALRQQLARIAAALDASEKQAAEQKVQIVDLGARLNQALASKVQELARYRSEFFGRVRQALGDRPDIRIVGDRFVFQSELLFPTASAVLEPAGRDQLAKLARTLLDIAAQMPADINWVLRVDGHTDQRRIANLQFPSNWELSTARAISVVKFLVEQGIPPDRLAAAGFAEFQPLDPGRSDEAMARNRRIELKFDQR